MRGSATPRRPARALLAACLLLAAACIETGCAGGDGSKEPRLGTVVIRNETDQGMAPLTVTGFFMQPAGVVDPGPNLLVQSVAPGAIVIVGQFQPGLYNASAMLSSGGSLVFMDLMVVADAPTNVVIPSL